MREPILVACEISARDTPRRSRSRRRFSPKAAIVGPREGLTRNSMSGAPRLQEEGGSVVGLWAADPGGVTACSRWLSVVCDTTGKRKQRIRTPAGVQALWIK